MHKSPFPLKKAKHNTDAHTHAGASTQTGSALSECCSFVPPSLWFMGHCTTLRPRRFSPSTYLFDQLAKKAIFQSSLSHTLYPLLALFCFVFSPSPQQTSHLYPPEHTGCKREANVLVLMRKKNASSDCSSGSVLAPFAWSLLPVSPPLSAFTVCF